MAALLCPEQSGFLPPSPGRHPKVLGPRSWQPDAVAAVLPTGVFRYSKP